MSRTLAIEAPAKVNLFLSVLGRRPDGFHDIETLFQSVSLADRVAVTVDEGAGEGPTDPDVDGPANGGRRSGAPPVHLKIDGPDLGPIESNLAYRAARRFQQETALDLPVRIELVKRIPAGAGLGGGSSDAAAVLRCLAALTGYGDTGRLEEVAAELGSDVPFFLMGSPLALGRGRGEVLTELRPLPEASLVLALPEVHVGTGAAYADLEGGRAGGAVGADARRGEEGGESAARRGAPRGSEAAAPGGGGFPFDSDDPSWADVARLACNDFEPVVAPVHDEIRASLDGLRAEGASVALLSGSGAASFGLFGTRADAERAAEALEGRHPWRFVVATTRITVPAPRPA